MYKKILLPVSGEERCTRALKALKRIVPMTDGEIILLHVTDPVPQTVGGDAREELMKQNHAAGLLALGPAIEELQHLGQPFHTRVEGGIIDEVIIKIAIEENADLIVMYTDGRNGLADMLLGSITERVLRNTDKDLLAIRN